MTATANPIVIVNVSTVDPPAPSTLLRTGAFISQGGTTTAANTLTLLTVSTDLATITPAAKTITSLNWSGGTVTAVTTAAHGFPTGQIWLTIAGATPAGYNGTFLCTVTNTTTFTYAVVSNPGAATVTGTVTPESVSELTRMNNTFFAGNGSQSVYVLELGAGSPAAGVTALGTWVEENPETVFAYLVPDVWDGESTFRDLAANYTSPGDLTYFFSTTTTATYDDWADLNYKSVQLCVNSPTMPSTQFSLAAPFFNVLHWNPTASNPVNPLSYSPLYGVTAYPQYMNNTLLTTLLTDNVNYIGTGAEGGLTNTIYYLGKNLDGQVFNYWYSIAWTKVNVKLALANEVINGSVPGPNPLFYNQLGVNRLQNRAAQILRNGVSYGLIFGNVVSTQLDAQTFSDNLSMGKYAGQAVINAEPLTTYSPEHPSDYNLGVYSGLSAVIATQKGFIQIVFNLQITNSIG